MHPINQDVTSAGVTNDNEFSFSVVADGQYMVDMEVAVSGNNVTADYTFDFQVSAGTIRGKGTAQNLSSTAAIQNIIVTVAGAANTNGIVCGIPTADFNDVVAMRIIFSFTATANATFRYRFGNNNVGAGGTLSWGTQMGDARLNTLTFIGSETLPPAPVDAETYAEVLSVITVPA